MLRIRLDSNSSIIVWSNREVTEHLWGRAQRITIICGIAVLWMRMAKHDFPRMWHRLDNGAHWPGSTSPQCVLINQCYRPWPRRVPKACFGRSQHRATRRCLGNREFRLHMAVAGTGSFSARDHPAAPQKVEPARRSRWGALHRVPCDNLCDLARSHESRKVMVKARP